MKRGGGEKRSGSRRRSKPSWTSFGRRRTRRSEKPKKLLEMSGKNFGQLPRTRNVAEDEDEKVHNLKASR